ncbi:MAG: hypothetical protein Q4D58_08495 [Synergistaceae bacterium]|nr:hypothetical protein [Synergistaceae bacterium]
MKKFKYLLAAAAAAAVIAAAAFVIYSFSDSSGMMSAIPAPSETSPYLLLETKEGGYPETLLSMLIESGYDALREGTPHCALLEAAAKAKESALLAQDSGSELELYCVLRLEDKETARLKKGRMPESLRPVFEGAEISGGGEEPFAIRSSSLYSPVYYAVSGKNVLLAADRRALQKMEALGENPKAGLGGKRWSQEESWPCHLEISDGGAVTAESEHKFPLTAEAAWREKERQNDSEPAGEMRWALVNLGKSVESYLTSSLKARKWNTSDCIIAEPLLLSAGVNLPPLDGAPGDWPFPLSSLGELAESLNMTDDQIREILSGQTVFSLGGQNRILWFSLPGLLVEFSGRPELMAELVDSFWKNLFFGAEPKPLEGFDYGGTGKIPFSVVGAGRGGIAVLGLTTPQSLSSGNRLGQFLSGDESAVGWLIADLPRIGSALSEMAKMSGFRGDDGDSAFLPYGGGSEEEEIEPLQPEISVSPFDQEAADAFGAILKRLGRVLVVWEKPLSGRVNWYGAAEK